MEEVEGQYGAGLFLATATCAVRGIFLRHPTAFGHVAVHPNYIWWRGKQVDRFAR
jgi:enterochelin esterase-like enzyme